MYILCIHSNIYRYGYFRVHRFPTRFLPATRFRQTNAIGNMNQMSTELFHQNYLAVRIHKNKGGFVDCIYHFTLVTLLSSRSNAWSLLIPTGNQIQEVIHVLVSVSLSLSLSLPFLLLCVLLDLMNNVYQAFRLGQKTHALVIMQNMVSV